jgi:hypothetical protein
MGLRWCDGFIGWDVVRAWLAGLKNQTPNRVRTGVPPRWFIPSVVPAPRGELVCVLRGIVGMSVCLYVGSSSRLKRARTVDLCAVPAAIS